MYYNSNRSRKPEREEAKEIEERIEIRKIVYSLIIKAHARLSEAENREEEIDESDFIVTLVELYNTITEEKEGEMIE